MAINRIFPVYFYVQYLPGSVTVALVLYIGPVTFSAFGFWLHPGQFCGIMWRVDNRHIKRV